MAVKTIVSYGHPALRIPAQKVEKIDDEILGIIEDLKDTLNYIGGLGLAAPQIGVQKQIFIADLSIMKERQYAGNKVAFINPEIVFSSKKTETDSEGCLSIMDIRANVERPFKIKMKGLIPSGVYRTIEATGLFARALQHEYDHLHGKLFIDYISKEEFDKNKAVLDKYIAEIKKNLPEVME